MGVSVDYEYYSDEFGGQGGPECFASFLGAAERQANFVIGGKVPSTDSDVAAYKRAVCAALDAFSEFGEGQVGGFAIGDFKVTNYEDEGTTGAEIATAAIVKELAGSSLLFAGVR